MQIADGPRQGWRLGIGLAPAESCPVIYTDSRLFLDLRLDPAPLRRYSSRHPFENHRWASLALAMDMHLETAHVDQIARRREVVLVGFGRGSLVHRPRNGEDQHKDRHTDQTAPDKVHNFFGTCIHLRFLPNILFETF